MRTLVLNATYEPLTVVSAQRAVVLVLGGDAELVETTGAMFRAASLSVEAPSVIRLTRNIRLPWGRSVPLSRRAVMARDRGKCAYCEQPAGTIDHVMPRSRGGRHEWANVVAACARCNHTKADRTPTEAKMRLLVEPSVPRGVRALAVTAGVIDPLWAPWLGVAA